VVWGFILLTHTNGKYAVGFHLTKTLLETHTQDESVNRSVGFEFSVWWLLPTYLPTHPPTYLPTYLLPTYPPTHPPTYIPTCLSTYPRTYLSTHPPTYTPTCLPTYPRTYLPTHLLPYLPSLFPTTGCTDIPDRTTLTSQRKMHTMHNNVKCTSYITGLWVPSRNLRNFLCFMLVQASTLVPRPGVTLRQTQFVVI